MSPTSTDEVEDTINSFYLNKAVGPNTVPTKILKKSQKITFKTIISFNQLNI